MVSIMECIRENSVIAAVRSMEDFIKATQSGGSIIFDLSPDISDVAKKTELAHNAGKKLFIHLDLASGIGKDKSGILFVKSIGVDGIISTRVNIIKSARDAGLFTVQRFFAVDSQSVDTAAESQKASKADMIEIMPGIVPKVISGLKNSISVPIIAGGLIETEKEISDAIDAGAAAVSTGKAKLWR
ncbi:MAG: glycerol-3-phosphate responsive antiterminator [Oscillospiraceae bacterium]|nr:glycerol-3-phosphate responsive antiterminator [Oscillospiraceae bacterium]